MNNDIEKELKELQIQYDKVLKERNELEKENKLLKKDLEILECFRKIDKKELKDFIEVQIKYTLNENSWLSACNCDLEKEKPTQHLIKIKEWLENE